MPCNRFPLGTTLTALVALTIGITCSAEPPFALTSWSDLEKGLLDRVRAGGNSALTSETVLSAPVLAEILQSRSKRMYREMLRQYDRPLVVLAGYYCMKRDYPSDALAAALEGLLNRNARTSLLLYAPLIVECQQAKMSKETVKTIAKQLARAKSSDRENLFVICRALNAPIVLGLVEEEFSADLPAVVIGAVADQFAGGEHRKRLERIMSELIQLPGYARVVWVMHADPSDPRFRAAVLSVLSAPETPDGDILVVVSRYRDYIMSNLKVEEISSDRARVDLIKRFLERRGQTRDQSP